MTYFNSEGSSSSETTTTTSGTTEVTAQNTIEGVGATTDTSVIISRMQQRRGLKQDLPQPLRPGEIGFTTDSQQLYIGADPEGAPSFVKTSVFESTPGSRVKTESIVNHQVFSFSLPFKKYAKGEFTGSAQSVSWFPTSKTITGGSETVFNSVITDADNVKSIITNGAFEATDLVVKKNGIQLTGNDTATYATLVSQDYIFESNTLANAAHTVTFRTVPQSAEEVTLSYYTSEAVNRSLSRDVVSVAQPSGSIYPGSSFKSFYSQYDVPAWDRFDPELIKYSDTTGTGFLGIEFKHISVRSFSTAPITTPNNLTLGVLYARRTSNTIVSGANIQGDPANSMTVTADVGLGESFANTGVYNHIVFDAAALGTGVSEGIWVDQQWLPVEDYAGGVVTANISLTGQAYRVGSYTGDGTSATITLADTRLYDGIKQNDELYVYGSHSGNVEGFTVTVSNDPSTAGTISGIASGSMTGTVSNVTFANYGPSGSGSNVQIVTVGHGLTNTNSDATAPGTPGIRVHASNNPSVLPADASNVTPIEFKATRLLTDENSFFVARDGAVTSNTSVTYVADQEFGNSSVFAYFDETLAIDLSSASSLTSAVALVDDAEKWPKLVITPDSTTTSGDVVFMQNAATDSVGQGFALREDPVTETLGVLQLEDRAYNLDDTRKAQLEKWFDDALQQNDLALYNTVGTATVYTTTGSDVTNIGGYTLPINEAFNEIVFDTREEAEAFNSIVNDLYFRQTNADIRGLVNIKTNLEIELREAVVSGDPTVTYTDTNEADIDETATNDPVPGLSFNVTEYDTYFIEYTMAEGSGVSATTGYNYARVGRMEILARPDSTFDGLAAGRVILLDTASDQLDEYTAGLVVDGELPPGTPALEFTSTITGSTAQINATNNTGLPLKMKYIVRRWNSLDS